MSFIYRSVLVIYSINLVSNFSNTFPIYIYFAGLISYIIILFFLFNRDDKWAFYRTIIDLLLIFFVLYEKPLDQYYTFTLLLLPVINLTNHSSDRAFSLKWLFVFYILIIITLLGLSKLDVSAYQVFVITIIFLLKASEHIKNMLLLFNNMLYRVLEEFYEKINRLNESYKIYIEIIKKFESTEFLPFNPDIIICFKVDRQGKFRLLNSSQFIVSYNVQQVSEIIDSFTDKTILYDRLFSYNTGIEATKRNNIFILIERGSTKYVFFIGLKDKPIIGFGPYLARILVSVFRKITTILEAEAQLTKDRNYYLRKLKQKVANSYYAESSIHFFNNKLTPITNYFEFLNLKETTESEDEQAFIQNKIDQVEKIARENISLIITRAQTVLRKSKNPYVIDSLEKIKVKQLIRDLREAWSSVLNDASIKIDIKPESFDQVIVGNTEAFEILFTDIAVNISKYNSGDYEMSISIQQQNSHEEFLHIKFSNNIKNFEKNIEKLYRLESDFNKGANSEILKTESIGIFMIKNYVDQMSISASISIIRNTYITELSLKLFKR
jgi:hypothetical protein